MNTAIKRTAPRAVAILLTVFAVAALTTQGFGVGGSVFESADGNLVVNGAGNSDWENAPGLTTGFDQPTGQTDDSFGQGTKEDTAVPTVVDGSIPNNKSDLVRFYVSSEKVGSTDFMYLAWERVQEPTGTTNMDFEFNQSAVVSANGTTPVRTAGDVLIKYDLSQGGTNPVLGFHRWMTTGNPSDVCEANNSLPCWGKVRSLSGSFDGGINSEPVSDPIPPSAPRTLSARTFGEAGIDLSGSGLFPAGQCTSFGRAYLKSRSSDSFAAAMKDFIAPIPVNVTNCGSVSIHKQDDAGASLQGAAFALYLDNAPQGGTRGAEDTATSFACTTGSSGDCSMVSVPFARYWVVESQGLQGYDLAADQNVTLPAGGSLSLTFVDDRKPGTIRIHKQDNKGVYLNGVEFTLYADNAPTEGTRGAEDTKVVSKSCTTAGTGDCSIGDVDFGQYWVVETKGLAGYDAAADQHAAIGATNLGVSLTFVNPRQPGSLSIHKQDDFGVSLAGAEFTVYEDAAPAGGSVDAGDDGVAGLCASDASGDCTVGGLDFGDYWIVETKGVDGYSSAAPQHATIGSTQLSDSLTFVNPRKPGKVAIHKVDDLGAVLQGAELTLYADNAPVGGARGSEDAAVSGKACTTGADGNCTITNAGFGDYWVVETKGVAGHELAADQRVTVGPATLEHALTFVDPRIPGVVRIHKQDDDSPPAAVGGATFTLYADNAPMGGSRGSEDTATAYTCITAGASGNCAIDRVQPGGYFVVETGAPAGYDKDADKYATVTLASDQTFTFTDARRFTVIVLVCRERDGVLYPSTVNVDGVDKTSLPSGTLNASACALGGARFEGKHRGAHPGSVSIPQ